MMQPPGKGMRRGVGYPAGLGGAVTQATSKATAVTLDKLSGAITTDTAILNAGVEVSFTVNNAFVEASDIPVLAIASGGTVGRYDVGVSAVAAGSFSITITNLSAGNLAEALVINFAIIKGAST